MTARLSNAQQTEVAFALSAMRSAMSTADAHTRAAITEALARAFERAIELHSVDIHEVALLRRIAGNVLLP